MKPIRTALFAPGSNERVMNKALESGADAVILDLEDSVALAAKAEARARVASVIDQVAATGGRRPVIIVRVNGAGTGLLADDLAMIVRPGLDAVMLPKAETIAEVQDLAAALASCDAEIILQIESALGVYRCFDLIQASPRVATTCIGGARDGDLQTDLGAAWSIEGTELLYARSKVLLDSRAAGVAYPLDGVFSDLADETGLLADSRLSARLGYVGRTVIHPKQIAPVRNAYAVPTEEIAYYQKVSIEFTAAEKRGLGAITVDGKLVDYAMFQRAQRVLELAQLDQ